METLNRIGGVTLKNIQKKILLITTGGTIASKKDRQTGQIHSGVISGFSLASLIPSWKDFSCEVHDLFQLPSGHLTMSNLRKVSQIIDQAFKEEKCTGVVLTHGTDTLEETAYFLDLILQNNGPVVLTGSQLPPEEIASDALRNLQDSLQVAISEESKDKGVVVVFNGKIYAAAEVIKIHTSNLDAFGAPGWGPIGYLDEKEVVYKRVVNNHVKLALGNMDKESKVYIIKFALGMDGCLIDMALKSGADGLVLEGFGRGQIPPEAVGQVKEAVNHGIPVVLTSRCYEGTVRGVYDYKGSAAQLERLGVILGNDLPGQKARIKLMLALNNQMSITEIKNLF
ncbi:MAG: hypothetical protein APF76_17960 [Desulfitibacter sp. BRH_c19]|nr:MAG: hypothetical protein APF76_17960 [Desulfitibacter sp. BRH_c19]